LHIFITKFVELKRNLENVWHMWALDFKLECLRFEIYLASVVY